MNRKRIKNIQINNKWELLLSVFMIAGIYVIVSLSTQMRYHSMDEWRIEGVLSGAFTGEPFYSHSYVNVILGFLISGLYKILPGINWWFLYNHFIVILGMFGVHFSFFMLAKKRQIPRYAVFFLLLSIDFILLLRWIIASAYTTAPVIFGTGAIAFLLFLSETKCRKRLKWIVIIVFIVNTLVTMERNQSGMCLIPFCLLAILYIMLKNDLLSRKMILLFCGISVALFFTQMGTDQLNQIAREQINEDGWYELFRARVSIGDYPHDRYWENTELYDEAGISEDVAALNERGIFFEDIVDPEAILYVCDNSSNNVTFSLENLKNTAKSFFSTNMRNILFIGVVSFSLAFLALFKCGKWYTYFAFLANNVGGCILFLYIMLRGRLYIRVAFVIAFPMIILNLLFFIENIEKERIMETIVGIVIPFSIVIGISEQLFLKDENMAAYNVIENTNRIENYVDTNPETIFFYTGNTYEKINPFRENYANILKLATGDVFSKSWRLQMLENGIEAYTGDVFAREDVVVLSTDNMAAGFNGEMDIYCLYRYLKDEKGCLGFVICDVIPDTNVLVYKFIFDTNAAEYEYYYNF